MFRGREIYVRLDAEFPCQLLDRLGPFRPFLDEIFGYAGDAEELSIVPMTLKRKAESFAQVPGERVSIDGAAGADPLVDGTLMEGAPLAVLVRPDEVEEDAVGVDLRVVFAARVVLESGGENVPGEDLGAAGAAPGVRAMFARDVLEGPPNGVVVAFLDDGLELGICDGPERAHGLVRTEGHVDSRRAPGLPGVAGEWGCVVGRAAVVESLELQCLDVFGILETEQSRWIPPSPVRFVPPVVVVEGRPEARHVPEIVGGGGGLGDGLHGGVPFRPLTSVVALARGSQGDVFGWHQPVEWAAEDAVVGTVFVVAVAL